MEGRERGGKKVSRFQSEGRKPVSMTSLKEVGRESPGQAGDKMEAVWFHEEWIGLKWNRKTGSPEEAGEGRRQCQGVGTRTGVRRAPG